MKTQTSTLITQLARDLTPMPTLPRAYGRTLLWGGAISLLMLWVFLGHNPQLADLIHLVPFWTKELWLLALLLLSGRSLLLLSRPGMLATKWLPLILLTALGMPVLGLWQSVSATPEQGRVLALGASWQLCSVCILLLALPILILLLRTLKGMAATRPTQAGAVAGVAASSLGALVYSLHCPETAYVFVALWYSLGITLIALLGAVLGKYWVAKW